MSTDPPDPGLALPLPLPLVMVLSAVAALALVKVRRLSPDWIWGAFARVAHSLPINYHAPPPDHIY